MGGKRALSSGTFVSSKRNRIDAYFFKSSPTASTPKKRPAEDGLASSQSLIELTPSQKNINASPKRILDKIIIPRPVLNHTYVDAEEWDVKDVKGLQSIPEQIHEPLAESLVKEPPKEEQVAGEEPTTTPPTDTRTRRLVRGTRKSYARHFSDDDDSSEDGLAEDTIAIRQPARTQTTKPTPKAKAGTALRSKPQKVRRAPKPKRSSDDDDGSEFNADSAEDADSFSESVAATEDDDELPSEEELSEDSGPPKRSKGKPATKVNHVKTSTSTTSTSAKQSGKPQAYRPSLKTKERMTNLTRGAKEIDQSLPPLSDIPSIFEDMTKTSLGLGLRQAVQTLKRRPLRVATMCSGTESPILALGLIKDALGRLGEDVFDIVHLFSAEIEPFKQAYIERNFDVPIIFRDITELTLAKDSSHQATTAYGSKVDVPSGVDLLIAGTACVDFSGLNTKKKDLADGGESGDTFRAVLAYAKVWRPRILILENVFTAPWDDMFRMYEEEGYAVGGALLDTKQFYLPQTRQRGYIACFDKATISNAQKAAKAWDTYIQELKRPASSPVSAFLLPNDDATVIASRRLRIQRGQMNDNVREVDWSKCAIRHVQYRKEKRIGNSRPYTSWQESGTLKVPDDADKEWFSSQVERVWDMMDCSFLRKALPGEGSYDAAYKTRVWDVSQNIDRFTDTAPFGISSCVTPSGIFFITDRGSLLTFHEVLILQGLPIDKISFTTETGKNIQDLAGNAMSSPVVGSAMLAALVAAFKDGDQEGLPASGDEMQDVLSPPAGTTSAMTVEDCAYGEPLDAQGITTLDVDLMRSEASSAAQKCSCEGPNNTTERDIQQCLDCGHTACLGCGGKPAHNYSKQHMSKKTRTNPVGFIKAWSPKMPSHLTFNAFDMQAIAKAFGGTKLDKEYLVCLESAVSSVFRFDRFRRGREWTVAYDAPEARLELCFGKQGACWQLYAKAAADLAGDSKLRKMLIQPIAISEPVTGNGSLLETSWKWRVPQQASLAISISPSGDQISAWRARLNVPGSEEERVWQELDIQAKDDDRSGSISGVYRHLPACGTACEGLYMRTVDDGQCIYFMLDPDPIGDPAKDSYVFTKTPARLPYGKSRLCIAKLDSAWRPWLKGQALLKSKAHLEDQWMADGGKTRLQHLRTSVNLRQALPSQSKTLDCSRARPLFNVEFTAPDEATLSKHAGSRTIKASDRTFFSAFRWIFDEICAHITSGEWSTLVVDNGQACQSCAPPLPGVRWKLTQDSLKPYEDPRSATVFEHLFKKRPDVFVVQASINSKGGRIVIDINVLSLAHRAIAKLMRLDSGLSRSNAVVRWCLDTAYSESPASSLPKFTLRNSDAIKAFDGALDLEIELWLKQRQTLTWMLEQESGRGRTHTVEESEETTIPELGWRVEARATELKHVRGGIMASHPGFGKTICSLSLIQSDFQTRTAQEICKAMKYLPQESGADNQEDAVAEPLRTAATLVITPKHLTQQWKEEVVKVLGRGYATKTIMIQSPNDLMKYKVEQFRAARIIIVNQDVFTNEAYVARLARFAGVPEPATIRGRDFQAWLKFAMDEVPKHLEILQKSGTSALASHISSKLAEHQNDETFKAFVPSKRLKGAKYAQKHQSGLPDDGDDDSPAPKGKGKGAGKASTSVKTSDLDKCLFEMFHFNRIIVDEFTYLMPKDYASIQAIHADKRWILSATARLQDPYDIARMASLIGVKLRIGENAPGAVSDRNLRTIKSEMTEFEKFQTFREAPSAATTLRTFELAQTFLDNFIRQDVLEFEDFPYQDHLVPITLATGHRVVYTELSQHLNSQDMRIKKGKMVEDRDRESRLFENLNGMEHAEEALSRLATVFNACELDELIVKRGRECELAEERLKAAIIDSQEHLAASKGEDLSFRAWKTGVVEDQAMGDAETTTVIEGMLEAAEQQHPAKKISVSGAKAGGKVSESNEQESRHRTAETNRLAKQYLATRRSVRFVKNVGRLLASEHELAACDCQGCQTQGLTCSTVAASSLCGHLICDSCLASVKASSGLCGAEGCKAPIQDYHLLRGSKLQENSSKHESTAQRYGAKIDSVVSLLEGIQAQNDQAILFVQYEEHIAILGAALKARSISSALITDSSSSTERISAFQKNTDPSTRSTVIILNASTSRAAGMNLMNANHVIFLAPLLLDTQYDYDASMAQAIGRARRPGQKKDIHVYRFVALDTIDVDILEHRERRVAGLTEMGNAAPRRPAASSGNFDPDVVMEDSNASGTVEPEERERTQLIRGSDGVFRLLPKSWLLGEHGEFGVGVEGRSRVQGYEDFSSLVKFSKAYSEE